MPQFNWEDRAQRFSPPRVLITLARVRPLRRQSAAPPPPLVHKRLSVPAASRPGSCLQLGRHRLGRRTAAVLLAAAMSGVGDGDMPGATHGGRGDAGATASMSFADDTTAAAAAAGALAAAEMAPR